ncbi:MAG: PKD domain-containing protein [Pseudorhodobacter sp.]
MARAITVSTRLELIDALATMSDGGTVYLEGGNYGSLALIDSAGLDLTFPEKVTIAAADPDTPPVITGLDLRDCANLGFSGITFDYSHEDRQPIWTKPFTVQDSTDISFTGCTFTGDLARGLDEASNGFPTGFGLNIRDSSGIAVTDSEISGFYRGLVVSNSNDVLVARNDVHTIRMDGMNFAAIQGVVIEDNNIHDFARSLDSADHSDMIQFWTNGTTRPSTDIVIRNNVLDIGNGYYTQSIFMRNDLVDRGLAGAEMFYRNVLIEGNVITNAHTHGITVGETAGLTVRSNSVFHSDGGAPDGADAKVELPKILLSSASTEVTVVQNATYMIAGYTGQADWVMERNAIVQDQDPDAAGWYGDVFTPESLLAESGAHLFRALPGGFLDELQAGAPATFNRDIPVTPETGSGPSYGIGATTDPDNSQQVTFTATTPDGSPPDGVNYSWNFDDGGTATGQTVRHYYADGGTYVPTLTVQTQDGQQTTIRTSVEVEAMDYLTQQADGSFLIHAGAESSSLEIDASPGANGGIQLGREGITATLGRDYLAPLFVDDGLTISFTLDADAAGATGELFRLHQSFVVDILPPSGELRIRAWSSEGDAVTLRSANYAVNDTRSHDIEIRLQGGQLSLQVDGQRRAEADFAGSFANQGRHDMVFGNPWGHQNFDGDLAGFSIDLTPTDDPFMAHSTQHDGPVI